jgi:hypothetical protein
MQRRFEVSWPFRPQALQYLVRFTIVLVAVLGSAAAATVANAAPIAELSATPDPARFRVGDEGAKVNAVVRNAGDAQITTASPVAVRLVAPSGTALRFASGIGWACVVATATCTNTNPINAGSTSQPIGYVLEIGSAAAPAATAVLEASGGGAPSATAEIPLIVDPALPFGVADFGAGAYAFDGSDFTQAAGHPYEASAEFDFNLRLQTDGTRRPVEDVRSILTELPAGFIGNPQVVAECDETTMVLERCSPDSQVGIANVRLGEFGADDLYATGIFRLRPRPGHAAEFGFAIVGIGIAYIYGSVRSDGDYGVTLTAPTSPANPPIYSVSVRMWGTPADPRHDAERCSRANAFCVPNASTLPPRPFLTNPSVCRDEPTVTRLQIDSWQTPYVFKTFEAQAPPVTGCDTLTFEPAVDIAPTTSLPDAPTGLNGDLSFPTEDNDEGLAPPPLKKAVVTLPEGITINPAAAGGLAACTDTQLNLKSKDPVTCPDAAKVGEVTATTPLLEETLSGGVYIRSQNSNDPESGEMFRLALVLENEERGLSIRLPGQVRVDKDSGRIETTFDNNPQLPVENVALTLKQGPRAPLATPPTCGEKTIDTVLTSWGGQTVERTSTFDVECTAGLGGFAPAFTAGVTSPIAGTFSPFALNITKADRDSAIDAVSLKLPTGLLAKVKGNVGSQVGSVQAFAGPGSNPFMLPGTVTLEGAYGDAPYSLRVVVPAKAGPFDLGDVTVRQKVYVDPVTAQVTVVSDPVPTIVKGVPVRLQRLDVDVDKPGFMINPTSCEAKEITGTLGSQPGQTAAVSSRFKVGECAALPFKPKLALSLVGKNQVTTGTHPRVKAQVNQTGVGEAGIQKAVVRLPKSLALDPENAQALCEFEAGTKPDLENHCPAGSVVGRARATTPLLERDLVGNVYFVKNVRKDPKTGNTIRTLPMIVVALRGEIAVNLKGESSTTKSGKLVNTFDNVPDAPISQFNLNIAGGKNGILAVTRTRKSKINVCASRQIAETDMDGQNGSRSDFNTRIKTPCAKSAKSKKAKKGQAGRK